MQRDITYQLQLQVLPGNIMLVPGCEPSSEITSNTLSRSADCGRAIVKLQDALNAIPGSYVVLTDNFSNGANRRKIFVLPPQPIDCPCSAIPDYYKVLKSLANSEVPVTQSFDYCDVIGSGFCPSPGFKDTPAPDAYPYTPEGQTPAGLAGFLNMPPNWNGDTIKQDDSYPYFGESF